MTSVRQMAACMGLFGEMSLIDDFFGYSHRGHTGDVSLLQQIRLLQGKHLDINLILVGQENFTAENKKEIDGALQEMRRIYGTVQLGIARVGYYGIPEADARESGVVGSTLALDDAHAITNDWSVDNDGLDVFFLIKWDLFKGPGTIGRSNVLGPCIKSASSFGFEMTGCVVSIEGDPVITANVLAHEAGHYLGLDHINDLDSDDIDLDEDGITTQAELDIWPTSLSNNLMFPLASPFTQQLTVSQGEEMKEHCFIKPGC